MQQHAEGLSATQARRELSGGGARGAASPPRPRGAARDSSPDSSLDSSLPFSLPMCNFLGEKFLGKVANAAHEHGYVGEVWGALKGDRNPGDATASSKASAASLNKNPCSWPLSPGTRGCHWQGSSRPRE